ncbi:E3 ubiquitin-protein like [Actinidia chinensis var. chinensis]|uniref:E3 ubiquitin-protein like n=1 Tax=Actinidia chinensis var. chinensis TaxID=1590841 RepID=A0A2R6PK95_ACTCC|nr:E3 ubiquitin-protein like [Actinidia chinensis var. chinensis]
MTSSYFIFNIREISFLPYLFEDLVVISAHGTLFSIYKKVAPPSLKGRSDYCRGQVPRSRSILTVVTYKHFAPLNAEKYKSTEDQRNGKLSPEPPVAATIKAKEPAKPPVAVTIKAKEPGKPKYTIAKFK